MACRGASPSRAAPDGDGQRGPARRRPRPRRVGPLSGRTAPLVKICGLTDAAGLGAALDAGADMVGFVDFSRSPRHLDRERARTLAGIVRGRARIVLLSVDADDASLVDAVEATAADVLQLHGAEAPERVRAVRALFGRPVIKALAVSERGDLARAADYADAADMLLFDARPPAGADRPGGNGDSFDWTIMRGFATALPWLLAGGLHEGNVGEALRCSGAGGVDVSSGVESAPGIKDAGRIARFVAAARSGAPLARGAENR